MAVRHNAYYNANELRAWPIADDADDSDDAGQRPPTDLLIDAELAFPQTLGVRAYVAAITVRAGFASVAIGVEGAAGALTAIAVVTVPAPVVPYQAYPVRALVPGVGGWLVFGGGVAFREYAGRFSLATQSYLLERCIRAYSPPLVTSLAVDGHTPLAGVISLAGRGDLAVTVENFAVDGHTVRAAFLRLANATASDVLTTYAGPCGVRPTSRTCPRPAIESIGGVVPDCNGNIDISFVGVTASAYTGGIAMRFGVTTAALCCKALPDASGKLRLEYADRCGSMSYFESSHGTFDPPDAEGPGAPGEAGGIAVPAVAVPAATPAPCRGPFYDAFANAYDGLGLDNPSYGAGHWSDTVVNGAEGSWGYAIENTTAILGDSYTPSVTAPVKAGGDLTARSNTLFVPDCDAFDAINRKCTVRIRGYSLGVVCVSGVVVNYHYRPSVSYILAGIDVVASAYCIWQYRNGRFTLLAISYLAVSGTAGFKMTMNDWYKVAVSLKPAISGRAGRVDISADFVGSAEFTPTQTLLVNDVDAGPTAGGLYGLGSDQSAVSCAYWSLTDI